MASGRYIGIVTERIEQLVVQGREQLIAVPYRSAKAPGGFVVYRPKLLKVSAELENCDSLVEAFFEGVDSHQKAAKVWNDNIGPSR